MSAGWQGYRSMRRWLPAVLAGALLAGCTDLSDSTHLAEGDVRYSLPTQQFQNVDMVHTDDGVEVFQMHAPHLDRYDNQNRAELYGGISIDFYKNGQRTSHLTADSGVVLHNGDELRGIGHVVVTTDTGTTILTPRMTWTRRDGLIKSDTIVTIITEYDTLHGTGLIATDDLRKRRILHPTGVTTRTAGSGATKEEGAARPAPLGSAVAVDTLSMQRDSTLELGSGDTRDSLALPPDSTAMDSLPSADTTGGASRGSGG